MATLQAASISLYILTFNCGRTLIDPTAFAALLFSNLSSNALPDILVLSLQELAPISYSFIGGTFLVPYFRQFSQAVRQAAAKHVGGGEDGIYHAVAVRNLGMTGLMVFAKDASAIRDVEHAGVGVGVSEMGDKGAVGVRFTYHKGEGEETELTFVAAHLQAHEPAVETRNQNWQDIVRRLVFSSNVDKRSKPLLSDTEDRPLLSISARDATVYKPTSHLFVAGDLNYRTSTLSPAPKDHKDTFPQPYHKEDHPNHYSNLFKLDQLNQEKDAGRTLHGLTEAEVTFPPTYKYQVGGALIEPDEEVTHWNWAKHRWPSWCDRILYLDFPSWLHDSNPKAEIKTHEYTALPLLSTSDHRPVALEFTVPLIPISPPEEEQEESDGEDIDPRITPPFEIDVNWKTRRDKARAFEVTVGYLAYFSTTWEGGALFLVSVAGALGAIFAFKAILDM